MSDCLFVPVKFCFWGPEKKDKNNNTPIWRHSLRWVAGGTCNIMNGASQAGPALATDDDAWRFPNHMVATLGVGPCLGTLVLFFSFVFFWGGPLFFDMSPHFEGLPVCIFPKILQVSEKLNLALALFRQILRTRNLGHESEFESPLF